MIPKVSIIMPTFNCAEHLKEAVDSIINQTFSNWELFVVDDDSSDETKIILEEYAHLDVRVKVLDGPCKGISAALNYGIFHATGKYIARMDGDDIARSERIEKQVTFMEENPDVDVCGTNYESVLPNGIRLRSEIPENNEDIQAALLFSCAICHPSLMVKKTVFQSGYWYDESMRYAEDYDLWLRMIPEIRFYNMRDVLMDYRVSSIRQTDKIKPERDATIKSARVAIGRLFGIDTSIYPEGIFGNTGACVYSDLGFYRYIEHQIRLYAQMLEKNENLNLFSTSSLKKAMQNRWEKLFRYAGMDEEYLQGIAALGANNFENFIEKRLTINDFVEKSRCLTNELLKDNTRIAVYGMGLVGKKVLFKFLKIKKPVVLFDKKVREIEIDGTKFKVNSPLELTNSIFDYVLIASDNFYTEIKEDILCLGIRREKILSAALVWTMEK